MFLAQNLKVFRALGTLRKFSSDPKLVNLSINERTGIATVTMQRSPVNSLNFDLLAALSTTFQQLEKDKIKGMILTSAFEKVYSAGLDILELYKPDPKRFKQFWTTFQDAWLNLYGSSYPTVAAITGHAPAGGCLLALGCERRIMVDNFSIGLNETALGFPAPPWVKEAMKKTIGYRQTELALTLGTIFNAKEALQIGLIDELASNKGDAIAKAEAFLNKCSKIPPIARASTKKILRGKNIQELAENRDEDRENFEKGLFTTETQEAIKNYYSALKKKK